MWGWDVVGSRHLPEFAVEGESIQCLESPGISLRIFGSKIQGWTWRTCGVSILGDAPAIWNIPELWGPGELNLSLNTQPRLQFLTLSFKQHFCIFIPGPAEKQQVLNWSKKSFPEIRNVK